MQPWKIFGWPPEQEPIIYREWGLFFTKKQNVDVADLYYNKSLALNPDDPKALYSRSQCERQIAHFHGGLADAKRALALDPMRQPFNLEVCDGVYQLNEFEQAKRILSNYSRKFSGKKVDAFNNRLDVVNENFKDSLGDTLGYFILQNGKHFDKVYSEMLRLRNIDNRPLWKILWEKNECDVLSILEKEEILLSPMEVARRKRGFAIFNQIYLRKSWIDALFLKMLTTNSNLLLPQSQLSRPILEVLTKTKYDVVMKMLKMLQARSPLYTETIRNCPNRSMKKKQTENYLFRVQNQVHRSMLKMLVKMHYLRKNRRLQKLRSFVEEVMGDYVVLKTRRVMPWKFEFIQEVYDLLALAYCDQYEIPKNFMSTEPQTRLILLLKLKAETEKEPTPYQFGKRATFQDEDAGDKHAALDKAIVARLLKRLTFAKYPIERAYLWHEIAAIDLKKNNFDLCCLIAERSVVEAAKCKSYIWMLHATMMICKAHAMLRKIEKISETLTKAVAIAKVLQNDKILRFLHLCESLNNTDLHAKKAAEALRHTKSRISMLSSRSHDAV